MNDPRSLEMLDEALRRAVRFVYERDFFKAEQLFRQLTRQTPPPEMAHFMYAHFKLLQGEYPEAWPHFMHRLSDPYYRDRMVTGLPFPLLAEIDDAKAPDQTLLVHMDEGYGDAMMCARYLPALADTFKKVLFMVYEGCTALFGTVDPRIELIEEWRAGDVCDVHVHLFSLPAIFRTEVATIPPAGCLAADPARAKAWGERLAGPGLKVGIAWQGKPTHPRDDERSLPLETLLPVLRTPGVSFFSLQARDGVDQLDGLPDDVTVTAPEGEIDDPAARFVETAAAIDNLDIVITIDSALAHLAGALGKPAWVLLPMVPDWRWMLDRDDSPWYPTARLFRCRARADWTAPIEAMAEALASAAKKKRPA
ncbi:MAG: glycosyltransferase family 9 protein [Rhodospirillales bacterium]